MPDTPIDLSEGIQSVRLKVPTAEVPIPPEGFAQLHSPAPGELALRLPDGSVVAVGGGGGGGGTNAVDLLGPNGQVLTDGTEPGVGIDISPIPPLAIRLGGPVQDQDGHPQAPEAVTLVQRSEAPDRPTSGVTVWADAGPALRVRLPGSAPGTMRLLGEDGASLLLSSEATLDDGAGGQLSITGGEFSLASLGPAVIGTETGLTLACVGVRCVIQGLPTEDPHVLNQLWIAPITRQLMVSAG